MAGNLFGAFIFGAYSDYFGRKKCLVTALLLFIVVSIGDAWITSFIAFLFFRFMTGLAVIALFPTCFVLGTDQILFLLYI